jgi:hypothetical protein
MKGVSTLGGHESDVHISRLTEEEKDIIKNRIRKQYKARRMKIILTTLVLTLIGILLFILLEKAMQVD